jgi:hypothetical protein
LNRPSIPLTLFLLSRPLEQLEFIRLSNFQAEISFFSQPSRPQRFILPVLLRNFQSRYRRHLFHFKPLFQSPRARRSLNQLSRLRIHSVQDFQIRRIQSRNDIFETYIVVIHDQIPHISLPNPSFLRSRRHRSRRRDDLCLAPKCLSVRFEESLRNGGTLQDTTEKESKKSTSFPLF